MLDYAKEGRPPSVCSSITRKRTPGHYVELYIMVESASSAIDPHCGHWLATIDAASVSRAPKARGAARTSRRTIAPDKTAFLMWV
jgi:hypothetical protein